MNYRRFAYIAVFGGLWGVWEIFAGFVIHALNIPVKGVVMSSVAAMIMLVGRKFVPERGATFSMGAVAAVLKLLSFSGFMLSPFIAILIESTIAEVVLTLSKNTFPGYFVAGGLVVMWSPLHRLLIQGLIFSNRIYIFYVELLKRASRLLGVPESKSIMVFVAYLAILFLFGAIVGIVSWFIGKNLRKELGR